MTHNVYLRFRPIVEIFYFSTGPMITIAGHTFSELPSSGLRSGNSSGNIGVTTSSSYSSSKPERCKYCDKSLELKSLGGAMRCACEYLPVFICRRALKCW